MMNNLQLALDLRRGLWLIDGADAFLPSVISFLDKNLTVRADLPDFEATQAIYCDDDGPTPDKEEEEIKKVVMIVPLHGPMTKYDTCTSYGTTTIAQKMLKLLSKDEVVGFILDIDSGGGCANAVAPLVQAIRKIREAGKPIIAHVDTCCSAAYWVASQCESIFMDNLLSNVGSIGAYAQILDESTDESGRRIVNVYAKESPDKNAAVREALDGKPEKMQKELSRLVAEFHAAVRSGRPNLKADSDGVMTGATFTTSDAINVGLADAMMDLDDCVENVYIRDDAKR